MISHAHVPADVYYDIGKISRKLMLLDDLKHMDSEVFNIIDAFVSNSKGKYINEIKEILRDERKMRAVVDKQLHDTVRENYRHITTTVNALTRCPLHNMTAVLLKITKNILATEIAKEDIYSPKKKYTNSGDLQRKVGMVADYILKKEFSKFLRDIGLLEIDPSLEIFVTDTIKLRTSLDSLFVTKTKKRVGVDFKTRQFKTATDVQNAERLIFNSHRYGYSVFDLIRLREQIIYMYIFDLDYSLMFFIIYDYSLKNFNTTVLVLKRDEETDRLAQDLIRTAFSNQTKPNAAFCKYCDMMHICPLHFVKSDINTKKYEEDLQKVERLFEGETITISAETVMFLLRTHFKSLFKRYEPDILKWYVENAYSDIEVAPSIGYCNTAH